MNFVVGKTAEVRLFLPVIIYSIPLIVRGAMLAIGVDSVGSSDSRES